MTQLVAEDDKLLSEVSLIGSWDTQHAIKSQKLKDSRETCIHWELQESIKKHPDSLVISSWDGDVIYSQLEVFASRLAFKLQALGVGPDSIMLP